MNAQIKQVESEGSSWQFGINDVFFPKMVEILGGPNIADDPHKVDASWCVEHDDGRRLMVWNYKNGPAYCGSGVSLDSVCEWSGHSNRELAEELFGKEKIS